MMRDAEAPGFIDLSPPEERFRDALGAGLSARPKRIPCKFLYDERGSALFEAICRTPEYYPTRTETAILEESADEIAALVGRHAAIVEFGSGSSRKVRILLDALEDAAAYVSIDISRDYLLHEAAAVKRDYPRLQVTAICADYTRGLSLPPLDNVARHVAFFPGSTIGNFEPDEAVEFLRRVAAMVGRGGMLLVGVDLKKEKAVLDAAYNDREGVTADFNLNLLQRANEELGADFDLARFEHEAFYNEAEGRIELYLRSLANQEVTVGSRRFWFQAGERIHTEHSYKYSLAEFGRLARAGGFVPVRSWTDPEALFSVHLLEA
jgi:dimethylhistidine N-methyltransferase